MAQASEELLIKIDIVDSDSANRINEISEELNHLKVMQKDYEQAVKEGKQLTTEQAKEYVAVKARIADLNKEVNAHVKALQQEQQEQKKNADSLNSMRAQLKDLIKAYDNMSKAERENAEVGGKQVAMINELTDQIKELEYATQRYQRNVGNYENAIKNALPPQLQFVNSLAETANEAGGAVPMMKNFGTAIGNVAKQAMAFIATPIGAAIAAIALVIAGLVGAFKTLQKAFQRTETNGDKLNESMGKLKGIGNALLKALEPLAVWFANTFAKAIDAVIGALSSMVKGLQKALDWIAKTTGSATMKNWANGLRNITIKTKEIVDATSDLATAEDKLHRIERDMEKTRLKYQTQAEKYRQQRDDDTKSIEERIQANENLRKTLEAQENAELRMAKKAVEVAQMRITAEGETKDALDALAEAQTRVYDIQERINGQRSEYLQNANALRKEAEEETKIIDELIKKVTTIDPYAEREKVKPVQFEEEDDEEIEDVTKIYTERNNLRLQYEKMGFDERLKLQKQNLDMERAQRIASGEDAINTEMWYQGELTRITAENAEARKQYALDVANSSMAGASSMISSLKELADVSGASAQYQKALALAEVALNTGQAISAGIASAMATPFPANIGAILTTISAVISGIAQAKSAIKSANIPTAKFAQGGLVTGEGTSTSDSIPAMLSNEEGVVKASAMAKYGAFISAFNEAEGGAPMATSTSIKSANDIMRQFADIVTNTPIYTAVTDINEGQARVAKIVDNSNY